MPSFGGDRKLPVVEKASGTHTHMPQDHCFTPKKRSITHGLETEPTVRTAASHTHTCSVLLRRLPITYPLRYSSSSVSQGLRIMPDTTASTRDGRTSGAVSRSEAHVLYTPSGVTADWSPQPHKMFPHEWLLLTKSVMYAVHRMLCGAFDYYLQTLAYRRSSHRF